MRLCVLLLTLTTSLSLSGCLFPKQSKPLESPDFVNPPHKPRHLDLKDAKQKEVKRGRK